MFRDSNVLLVHRPIAAGRAALFLDRDGVINVDTGYVSDPESVVLLPGAAAMISAFNSAYWPVIVVSNQSGYGRAYFSRGQMLAVQERIEELLSESGAYLDAVFFCGVAPEQTGALATWRKPEPGMLLAAKALFDVDLAASVLVGDKVSDLEAADRAGLRAMYLVNDRGALPANCGLPAVIAHDLGTIRPPLSYNLSLRGLPDV